MCTINLDGGEGVQCTMVYSSVCGFSANVITVPLPGWFGVFPICWAMLYAGLLWARKRNPWIEGAKGEQEGVGMSINTEKQPTLVGKGEEPMWWMNGYCVLKEIRVLKCVIWQSGSFRCNRWKAGMVEKGLSYLPRSHFKFEKC